MFVNGYKYKRRGIISCHRWLLWLYRYVTLFTKDSQKAWAIRTFKEVR